MILWIAIWNISGCGKVNSKQDAIEMSEFSEEPTNADKKEGEKAPDTLIYVQIAGAVTHPGVYALKKGSRVFEAVELAGGMTPEADFNQCNQAKELTDGEMIQISTLEETNIQKQATEIQQDGKVNLNTATQEQLMTLPGIGESKAMSILAFREKNGGFSKIEELKQIEGIKEGVYSKIEDSIKVN